MCFPKVNMFKKVEDLLPGAASQKTEFCNEQKVS